MYGPTGTSYMSTGSTMCSVENLYNPLYLQPVRGTWLLRWHLTSFEAETIIRTTRSPDEFSNPQNLVSTCCTDYPGSKISKIGLAHRMNSTADGLGQGIMRHPSVPGE